MSDSTSTDSRARVFFIAPGDVVDIGEMSFVVSYLNASKNRISLEPAQSEDKIVDRFSAYLEASGKAQRVAKLPKKED